MDSAYSVIHVIRQMITYLGTGICVTPCAPLCRFPPLIVEYPEKTVTDVY